MVGSKSYPTVVETHDAAVIRTLTSPVADMYLAAGAFFLAKMTTLDLKRLVADRYLATGSFFSCENDRPWI